MKKKELKPPSRDSILMELYDISLELQGTKNPMIQGEALREADKLLDWYIELGYMAVKETVPPQGYQPIES